MRHYCLLTGKGVTVELRLISFTGAAGGQKLVCFRPVQLWHFSDCEDSMALIEWDESYSVNHAEIDAQHRKWVAIINDLANGLEGSGGDFVAAPNKALSAMMDYTRRHFMFEERYMREIGFPETIEHIKIHNECYGRISAFLVTAESGGNVRVVELLQFLRGWLLDHILNEDKKYSLHLTRSE